MNKKSSARFGLLFVCIGLGISGYGFYQMHLANLSKGWPTVQGIIVSSELKKYYVDDQISYGANLLYEYTLNDIVYSSDRISFTEIVWSDPSHARNILNKYTKGSEVTVNYNPDDPRESVLEPGIDNSAWFTPILGFVFFIVIGLIFVRKSMTSPSKGGME